MNTSDPAFKRTTIVITVIGIAGMVLIHLAKPTHHWALYALKPYIATVIVFGYNMIYFFRRSLLKIWFWIVIIPLAVGHAFAMYWLIQVNRAFPQMDLLPRMTWGILGPAICIETGIFGGILAMCEPAKKELIAAREDSANGPPLAQ